MCEGALCGDALCGGSHVCGCTCVGVCVRVLVCFSSPRVQLPTCACTLGDLNTVSTKGKATSVGE